MSTVTPTSSVNFSLLAGTDQRDFFRAVNEAWTRDAASGSWADKNQYFSDHMKALAIFEFISGKVTFRASSQEDYIARRVRELSGRAESKEVSLTARGFESANPNRSHVRTFTAEEFAKS
jgi:hypothetical protein